MTTYSTYQEAKIANPELEVYRADFGGVFISNDDLGSFARFTDFNPPVDVAKCNPADYCMTVEGFLGDGHKFVDGDAYLDGFNNIQVVGELISHEPASCPGSGDEFRYVLRAAALEQKEEKPTLKISEEYIGAMRGAIMQEKPKRTKVEWEKVEFEKVSDVALACESGEGFYCENSNGEKSLLGMYGAISMHRHSDSLYRRIETEITERDEFIEAACSAVVCTPESMMGELIGDLYDSGRIKLVD